MFETDAHRDTEHVTRCMAYLVRDTAARPLVIANAYLISTSAIRASGEVNRRLDLDESYHIKHIIHTRELGRRDTLPLEEHRPSPLELSPVYTKFFPSDTHRLLGLFIDATRTQYEQERA